MYLFWSKLKQLVFLLLSFVSFGSVKNHLSRKRSEEHGPLMTSLESNTDTSVTELGLATNTDQDPEFQERPLPASQQNQEVLVFQRDPPPSQQPAWLYKSLKTTPVALHRL